MCHETEQRYMEFLFPDPVGVHGVSRRYGSHQSYAIIPEEVT